MAIAGRLEIPLTLDDFQKFGSHIPLLVNLMPSGKYLMEDFYYSGGIPAVIKELLNAKEFHGDVLTVNGKTMKENNEFAECYNKDVIYEYKNPLKPNSGIVVLRGNLAENGAVIFFSFSRKKFNLQFRL